MILIPAGWFWMGSEGHYDWESPRHRVFLDAFRIAATPVTRSEYGIFLQVTGHVPPNGWNNDAFSKGNQPVVGVNWFDAVAYCEWMSGKSEVPVRLPTEAEWEKACRGGIEGADYAWGDAPPDSIHYFAGNWPGPKPVAQWRPNGYGLFNLGDNVHEWCSDWFAADYYRSSPVLNPTGPKAGTRRASRGGSWRHQVKGSRAAHRSSLPPEFRYTDYGFRVASSQL